MTRRVVALDFDGVIADSAVESFVVAIRTYARLRAQGRLAGHSAHLRETTAQLVRADPLYRNFLEMMPLGNRAEDFGVVLSILEKDQKVDDQAGYDRARAEEPTEFLDEFHELFYRERAEFQQADPQHWCAWVEPYEPFVRLLRSQASRVTLCIATAKDRPSVDFLLDRYGLKDLFPAERVIDKEHGRSKRAHLEALRERLGVDFSSITFVDDKYNHLEDVAPLGVRCVLAAWGYNGPREHRLAEQAGYGVCDFDQAGGTVFPR
ncbi:HAD family hydrolase [Myxococcota bacterium]|nr:HAD family hydrolase [Myxococcota bacterium]